MGSTRSSPPERVVDEPESEALDLALAGHVADQDVLVSSSLAWVEVERALRSIVSADLRFDVGESARVAMSGIAERVIGADVVSLARRIEPPVLRTLDAIHRTTAVLLDADLVITYDDRLTAAARRNSLDVVAPAPT